MIGIRGVPLAISLDPRCTDRVPSSALSPKTTVPGSMVRVAGSPAPSRAPT